MAIVAVMSCNQEGTPDLAELQSEVCDKFAQCGELGALDVLTCKGFSPDVAFGIWEDPSCYAECVRQTDCAAFDSMTSNHWTGCGCELAGAESICEWARECGDLAGATVAECVAHPGAALDLPDGQIPCLAECLSRYSCETAGSMCDNEEPGTPCYGYPQVSVRWPADVEAEQCQLVEDAVCGCLGSGTKECLAATGLSVVADCYEVLRSAAAGLAFDAPERSCLADASCADNARWKSHPEWGQLQLYEFLPSDCEPLPPGLVATTVGTSPADLVCPAKLEGELSVPGSATDPCDQTNPTCIELGGQGVNCCMNGHWSEVCQCRLPGEEVACEAGTSTDPWSGSGGVSAGSGATGGTGITPVSGTGGTGAGSGGTGGAGMTGGTGGAGAGFCGDGVISSGEQCDGSDLGGATCETMGFSGGALQCSATCMYNLAMCAS